MKRSKSLAILPAAVFFVLSALGSSQLLLDFENQSVGKAPQGFSMALTGRGRPGIWEIREDPTAPRGPKVLAQTDADPTDYRFPVCVYDGITARNVDASVQFKPVSGKVDQAGGIVVRYRDKDNYYITRANALENNVRLYHVVAGKRVMFAGKNVPVTSNQWHALRLEVREAHFKVSFDGRLLFEADDSTLGGAGKVGLWTKADSVTYFDDFRVWSQDTP